jgi:hypothetical protein
MQHAVGIAANKNANEQRRRQGNYCNARMVALGAPRTRSGPEAGFGMIRAVSKTIMRNKHKDDPR